MSEYDVLINKYNTLNAGYDQLYPKPMKHANTHANGGTDPITPSDIGAYSKNETDTLLASKAPAGFGLGLGGSAKALSANDDINDMFFGGGWYYYHSDNIPQNAPNLAYTHIVRIDALQGNVFVQTIYGITDGYGYQTSPVVVRRFRYGSMIRPWEYVNPPMVLGIEYRTTERWKGKPVYALAFDFGALPNASTKLIYAPAAAKVEEIIAYGGEGAGYALPTLYPSASYASFNVDDIKVSVRINVSGGIACAIGTGLDLSSKTATVWVKYTKTTD